MYRIFDDYWTMVSLTTYLNAILLFMAYSDHERVLSRNKTVLLLALVDFIGALASQISPDCILNGNLVGCSVMLPYELFFLVCERLAFCVNTHLLKKSRGNELTRSSSQHDVFFHGVTLLLSLIMVTVFFPGYWAMRLVFHSVIRNTLLRAIFFLLDGILVYCVNAFAPDEHKKGRIMIFEI